MKSDLQAIVFELSAYSVSQLESMFGIKMMADETINEFVERCALIELQYKFK